MDKTKRNITRFILKALPLVIIPLALITLLYWVLDPFGSLRLYDNFYDTDYCYNRGMISVRMLKKNIEEGYKYNSFLLGSSMSLYYPAEYWEKKLGSGAKAIHFDSSAQSITTLRRSVEYIDKSGLPIDNVLIILAAAGLRWEEDNASLPLITPPEWQMDWKYPQLLFQYRMYRNFYDRQFLRVYLPFRLFGKTFGIEGKIDMEKTPIDFVAKYNEPRYSIAENIIAKNPADFYKHQPRIIGNISDTARYEDMLSEVKKADLLRIKEILDKHNTNYFIIVSPNPQLKDISKADEAWMRQTFGNRFYDFVRPMAEIAVREDTYYDGFHYRPHVAKMIIDSIYR